MPRRLSEVGLRMRPKGAQMTDTPFDELGPVDYVVVEFPAGAKNFTGEMAAELLRLVDAGTIRVIDVLILDKNEDGSVDVTELSDVEELGELQAIETELAELLAADDFVAPLRSPTARMSREPNFCEIFGVIQFLTFATLSAISGPTAVTPHFRLIAMRVADISWPEGHAINDFKSKRFAECE